MAEKIQSQLLRMLQKVSQKFPQDKEPDVMTDIHLRINQDTGDLMAFDDDDNELTRIVVEEWIDKKEDDGEFYQEVTSSLRQVLMSDNDNGVPVGSSLNIILPYCFVLENELGEHIDELYIADNDDTIIIGEPFMEGLNEELEDFFKKLME